MAAGKRPPLSEFSQGNRYLSERHAIYFAPPGNSSLHRTASAWLGRDALSGATVAQPELPALPRERFATLTASPRRYGFHATIKAPFTLAPGRSPADLAAALRAELASHAPFQLPLKVALLEGFLALVPSAPSPPMAALETSIVAGLDPFRAKASDAELARRRTVGLSPEAEANLDRYGYPWVGALFRFHMTLSERLAPGDAALLLPEAQARFAPLLREPVLVDALCLFHEPSPGAPMLQISRHPLSGAG